MTCQELPQNDPMKRKPDITKAREILGWEPRVDRAEGLRRTLEYFKEHISEVTAGAVNNTSRSF